MPNNNFQPNLKHTLLVALITVLVFLLVQSLYKGNQEGSNPAPNATTTSPTEAQPVDDRVWYDISVATSTQETDSYRIDSELPQGSSTAAVAARNYLQDRQSEFTKFIAENTNNTSGSYQPTYTLSANLQTYQTNRFISFVYKVNEYTGGAHANTSVRTFVEDKATAELISLPDIVPAEDRSDFVANVRDKLRTPASSGLAESDLFLQEVTNLEFQDINHFYITEAKIGVLFPPYAVAPGAAGTVSVEVNR